MLQTLGLHRVAYFYAAMFGAALLLGRLAGVDVFTRGDLTPPESLAWLLAGALLGLAVAGLTVVASRFSAASRGLDAQLAAQIGPVDGQEALLMAAFSALGEELFFRGALQPLVGLVVTSALFMLAHLPPRRAMWPWTVMAGCMGVGLGALVEVTGSVLPAVGLHFAVNAINLARLGRLAASDGDAPSR